MAGTQNQTKRKGKRGSRKPNKASNNPSTTTEGILQLGEAQLSLKNVPFPTNEGESHGCGKPFDASSGVYKVLGDQDFGYGATFDLGRNGPIAKNSGGEPQKDIKLLKRISLTPPLASQLRRNVIDYAAAVRANVKVSLEPLQPLNNSWPSKNSTEQFEWEDSCIVNLVLGGFDRLNLNDKSENEPDDSKIELISSLVNQSREVKKQVSDRKEWACKKVIQAARKLSHDLIDLKMLRMEREEKLKAKSQKQKFEEETMKRLIKMENAARKANCQADLANADVKRLEMENAEIRAEMEAFKLSTSESDEMCVEIAKRERKCIKKIMACEKHNKKTLEEINEENKNSLELQQLLANLTKAQEDFEVKWRRELQAKEIYITRVKEELRLKGDADTDLKRKQEVRQKMEIDCQRCKDDMERLEQEISSLEMFLDSADPYHLPEELELQRIDRDTFGMILPEFNVLTGLSEDETSDRVCLMCTRNEASVLFLPCAHQVLCANCTEDHCINIEARCPCCHVLVAQRIRVYGGSC